jgi:hypothetical protein
VVLLRRPLHLTGTPGSRDWLANVKADPRVVVEAGGIRVAGKAREVTDRGFKRRFFEDAPWAEARWSQAGLDRLVAESPMIEVEF